MSHIPKKALVFYCPLIPNQAIPNIDKIALAGCSGQIALEYGDVVTQLLGIDSLEQFKKRFNDMTVYVVNKDTPMTAEEILKLEQDVVMVDLTDYRGNAYQLIDQACQHNRPDTIYSIISPAPSIQPKTDNWWSSIVPRQSHMMKQGIQVPVQKDKLVYSYLHAGSCRRDSVERYDPLEITQYGSQHTILAWHFMAEIAHKLGFVDKYGA